MKKFACFMLLLSSGIHSLLFASFDELDLSSKGVILMSFPSGDILYEKNAREKLFPASITKVATALFALQKVKDQLDRDIVVDRESVASITEEARIKSNFTLPAWWIEVNGSHIGLKNEEVMSLRDLFYGMLLSSGNDASNVIARHASGSVPKFIQELNHYLLQIGCRDTNFKNPHGHYDPNHYTTPYDMAVITSLALKDPFFREVVKCVRRVRPKTNKQEESVFLQTNRLLRKGPFYYEKAIGVKTGGGSNGEKRHHSLIAAAEDKGRTVIAVLMGAKERNTTYEDAIKLFNEAFQEKLVKEIFVKIGDQPWKYPLKEIKAPISTYTKDELFFTYFPSEKPQLKAWLEFEKLDHPIKQGQKIGQIQLKQGLAVLKGIPLFAKNDSKLSFRAYLKAKKGLIFICWGGLILLGFMIVRLKFMKEIKKIF